MRTLLEIINKLAIEICADMPSIRTFSATVEDEKLDALVDELRDCGKNLVEKLDDLSDYIKTIIVRKENEIGKQDC